MLKPLSIALVLICIVNAVMCFVSQNMDGLIGFMMALIFLVTSILLRNELESVVAQAKHKATPTLHLRLQGTMSPETYNKILKVALEAQDKINELSEAVEEEQKINLV